MIRSRGKYRIQVDNVPPGNVNFYGLQLMDGISVRCVVGRADLVYRNLSSRFGERIRLVADGQVLPPLPAGHLDSPAVEEPEATPEPELVLPTLDDLDDPRPKRKRRG